MLQFSIVDWMLSRKRAIAITLILLLAAGAAIYWFLIREGRDTSPQTLGPAPPLGRVAPQIGGASDLSQNVSVTGRLGAQLWARPGSPLAYYSAQPSEITLSVAKGTQGAAYELGIDLTGDPFSATVVTSDKQAFAQVGERWYELAGSLIPSDAEESPTSELTPEWLGNALTRLRSVGITANGSKVAGEDGSELYRYELRFTQPRVVAAAVARELIGGSKKKFVEARRARFVDRLAPIFTRGHITAAIQVYSDSYALQSIELGLDLWPRDLAPIFSGVRSPDLQPPSQAQGEESELPHNTESEGVLPPASSEPEPDPQVQSTAPQNDQPPAASESSSSKPTDPFRPFVSGAALTRLQVELQIQFSGWGQPVELPQPGARPLPSPQLRSLLYRIAPTLIVPAELAPEAEAPSAP